jgi:hypothetical protein
MSLYLSAIAIIFAVLGGGILVDRLYRGFAARHPQLGPFRDGSQCGTCSAGSGCSAADGATDPPPAATPRG